MDNERRTEEICLAVENYGKALYHPTREQKTSREDPFAIGALDADEQTEKLCWIALKANIYDLRS